MNYSINPPTYEESERLNLQNRQTNVLTSVLRISPGPDKIYGGIHYLIADFIPCYPNSENLSYMLVRVNDWLSDNCQYNLLKCEFVPCMVNSRKLLDLSKCYIFNLTFGRTYFINQFRLHILIDKAKTEADQIYVKSYVPELLTSGCRNINLHLYNNHLFFRGTLPVYETLSDLITKVNVDIDTGNISGTITNVSTFYSRIPEGAEIFNHFPQKNEMIFYIKSCEPKLELKSLRVFYKPGSRIGGSLNVKSFLTTDSSMCLDELTDKALEFISNIQMCNFVSMETFPEYEEENKFINSDCVVNSDTSFIYGIRLRRIESIKVFYLENNDNISKPLQTFGIPLKIFWATPIKSGNYFESYSNFMDYVNMFIKNYGEYIIDIETLLIPNSLSWSRVRHQTIMRYHNESCTNYQIYSLKIILNSELDLSNEISSRNTSTVEKRSDVCSIL